MSAAEIPVVFELGSGPTAGVLHLPHNPRSIGVVCLIGGRQTRIGPQRSDVFLARCWSAAGFPVLRFDYGGKGDSSGEVLPHGAVFEDVRSGMDALLVRVPEVTDVVLWGTCGACLTAVTCANRDDRVKGIMVGNPTVGQRHILRVAIRRRLALHAPGFTRPVQGIVSRFGGLLISKYLEAGTVQGATGQRWLRSLNASWGRVLMRLSRNQPGVLRRLGRLLLVASSQSPRPAGAGTEQSFLRLVNAFSGDSLFLLSDDDVGAIVFVKNMLGRNTLDDPVRVQRRTYHPIKGGGHTFGRRACLEEVASVTSRWLLELPRHG